MSDILGRDHYTPVAVVSANFQQNGAIFGCAQKESREVLEQSRCVVIVSSPCDFPTRGGLKYEFVRFPDPVEGLCMKQFWSVFLDGFLENFTEV